MTLDQAKLITRTLVIATPIVWIAWDLVARIYFGDGATESVYIRSLGRDRWFSLGFGLLGIGLYWHFFLEK
jgi:hypothetical protein